MPPEILSSSLVDWRGVRTFLALAFGLAWTVEGVALALGVDSSRCTEIHRSTALSWRKTTSGSLVRAMIEQTDYCGVEW